MLRLAFDFIITWRETRTRPNAYEGVLVFRVMLVGDELGSVIAVQSVFGGNPYHAVPVLIYFVDQTAGKFPVCCEEFVRLSVAQQRQKKK